MSVSVDEMIGRLEFFVKVRQLGIAELMAKEFRDEASSSPLKESGYAILSVVMSYFEMIEQFDRGLSSHGQSAAFFLGGFRKVYPATVLTDPDIRQIYGWVRCGMYHTSLPKGISPLSRYFPVGFAVAAGEIRINPGKVVEELTLHFDGWIATLRNTACCENRCYFEQAARLIGMDRPDSPYVTTTRTTPAPWEQG